MCAVLKMTRFCSLCDRPAVDDSRFCEHHRAQASAFAESFAPSGRDIVPVLVPEVTDAPDLLAFREAVESMAAAAALPAAEHRFAELAFYYLGGKLRARTYYGVRPPHEEPLGKSFTTDGEPLQAALAPGGRLHESLCHLFLERKAALIAGELELLSAEVRNLAGGVLLFEKAAGRKKRLLACYAFDGDAFVFSDRGAPSEP